MSDLYKHLRAIYVVDESLNIYTWIKYDDRYTWIYQS